MKTESVAVATAQFCPVVGIRLTQSVAQPFRLFTAILRGMVTNVVGHNHLIVRHIHQMVHMGYGTIGRTQKITGTSGETFRKQTSISTMPYLTALPRKVSLTKKPTVTSGTKGFLLWFTPA